MNKKIEVELPEGDGMWVIPHGEIYYGGGEWLHFDSSAPYGMYLTWDFTPAQARETAAALLAAAEQAREMADE